MPSDDGLESRIWQGPVSHFKGSCSQRCRMIRLDHLVARTERKMPFL